MIKRIAVFYDGGYFSHVSNYYLHHSERRARISIQGLHDLLREEVASREQTDARYCRIVAAHYFRGRFSADEMQRHGSLESERDFEGVLHRAGVTPHYLPVSSHGDGPPREKGIDVWLALEAFALAHDNKLDVVILISGDGDFVSLVRKLHGLGTRVMVTAWDFEIRDARGPRRTRTAQSLIDEATYPVMMDAIITDRSRRNDPLIENLFFVPKSAITTMAQMGDRPGFGTGRPRSFGSDAPLAAGKSSGAPMSAPDSHYGRGAPSRAPAEGSFLARDARATRDAPSTRGIPSHSPAEGSFLARGAPSARGIPSRSPAEGSSPARGIPSRSPAEGSSLAGDALPARGIPSHSPAEGSSPARDTPSTKEASPHSSAEDSVAEAFISGAASDHVPETSLDEEAQPHGVMASVNRASNDPREPRQSPEDVSDAAAGTAVRARGVVSNIPFGKSYGFIRPDSGDQNLFFHETQVQDCAFENLRPQDVVEFTPSTNWRDNRPIAENVVRLSSAPVNGPSWGHE